MLYSPESKWGREVHDLVKSGKSREAFQKWVSEAIGANADPINNPKMTRTIWEREIAFADQYNEPGRFTAMIGFEWTSTGTSKIPGNLHRVVIFKDDGDKASQVLPYSTVDSYDPEDLWDYEAKTGGTILAIAHNGNLSNGIMFPVERMNGQERAYTSPIWYTP
jgi:hypothetical protein